ncbi:MAG TPA: RNA polymerase sigma factor [Candidatus Limnocylindrales bacterium]|nr:RNA polymerase sigma factor [Candidatus Limnocylindrales bacterium]
MEAAVVAHAYESHFHSLLGYVTSLTRDREDAADLVHEAYVRLVGEVERGKVPTEPRAWLFRVGRNLAVSGGRRRQVRAQLERRLTDGSISSSAEEMYLVAEAGHEVRVALADICAIDRQALLMAAEGYSGAEIALALGVSEGALRTRQCRARARLRQRLVKRTDGAAR